MIGEYKLYNTYDLCGNVHDEYEGRGRDIIIGGSHTGSFPLTLSMAQSGVLAEKTYNGLIGLPVLKCFNLIIIFSDMRVYLEPNPALETYSKNTKH
jgi:hypothetical protein